MIQIRRRVCLLLSSLFFFLLSAFPHQARAASPDEYRTPEYAAGGGLDYIHAAEAYALGYSGKGVTIGILDDKAFPEHQEFIAKRPYPVDYFGISPTRDVWHGAHVAGIAAASKNDLGMHGVAWGADLASMNGIGGPIDELFNDAGSALRAFSRYPHVSIINNSWGDPRYFPAEFPYAATKQTAADMTADTFAGIIGPMASERDILFVFAAGNNGRSSPSVIPALPTLALGARFASGNTLSPYAFAALSAKEKRALSLNMLNVLAFDHRQRTDSVAFIPPFSDLADGATQYSLLAPGVHIYSSVGPEADSYDYMRGTSMAAPHIAGVAALTREAFPYMGGKQLADTLLSTATPLVQRDGLPPFIVQDKILGGFDRVVITAPNSVSIGELNDHEEELRDAHRSSLNLYFRPFSVFMTLAEDAVNSAPDSDPGSNALYHIIPQAAYERLFGMGIVNAARAVRGPGWFDANRLDNADRLNVGGTPYAMYPVDTKGYTGVWSNDIGQIKVDAGIGVSDPGYPWISDLAGLDVGLVKAGAGALFLSGNNSYLGPTMVRGGMLSLGAAGQADGEARLAGDVVVEAGGTFGGNGVVWNLLSEGVVIPGLPDAPSSVLRVAGDAVIGGTLRFVYPGAGAGGLNRLDVAGLADLERMRVELTGLDGDEPLPHGRQELVSTNHELTEEMAGDLQGAKILAQQGVTLQHSFMLTLTPDNMYVVYEDSKASPQAKALSEGWTAGVALLNQGADAVAGLAVPHAGIAARTAARDGWGLASFAAVMTGKSRYATGSHADMRSFSFLAGVAAGFDAEPGFLTGGAFFEYGNGSYSTHNAFANFSSVSGDGDADYLGGGVLGRMDFRAAGPGRAYIEASGRTGRTSNSFYSGDLRDYKGRSAEYDAGTPYYGIHGGLGYVWDMTDAVSLDLYGKYFWTRQRSNSVALSTGEHVDFKAVDSYRIRVGGRGAYLLDNGLQPYIGAAWEHEFDGVARASVMGYAIDAPSLRGDTGIAEIGLSFAPGLARTKAGKEARPPIFMDLGLQLYTGKREGITGSLQFKYEF
ncbi:MAG: S8 family serine peptidase [Desulfovibrio sp.]|jgi:autotransporter-associated beta strand protein|nr:S8 family serine peptidase [Desulfovibrio sp.]